MSTLPKILADNEEWTARKDILKSVPGIGNETAGKKHKEAIIAVAHKMLKIAHSLLKNQEMWKNKLNTLA